jgi:hypothetical protein
MTRAVLFDVDGTLIDSNDAHAPRSRKPGTPSRSSASGP